MKINKVFVVSCLLSCNCNFFCYCFSSKKPILTSTDRDLGIHLQAWRILCTSDNVLTKTNVIRAIAKYIFLFLVQFLLLLNVYLNELFFIYCKAISSAHIVELIISVAYRICVNKINKSYNLKKKKYDC